MIFYWILHIVDRETLVLEASYKINAYILGSIICLIVVMFYGNKPICNPAMITWFLLELIYFASNSIFLWTFMYTTRISNLWYSIISYPEDLVVVCLFLYGFLIFSDLDNKCSDLIPIPYYLMLLILIIQLSTCLKYISWLILVWMWLPIAAYVVYMHYREREPHDNESSWEQFEDQVFNNLDQKSLNSEVDSQYDACSICLIEFTQGDHVITLPWNERHFFHKECIRQWLHQKRTCPLWSHIVE